MDTPSKIDFKNAIGKLSPVEKIYEEIEREKLLENIVGFVPMNDSTDSSMHIINIAATAAKRGKNVCIVDAKVFYPSIYKLIDCEVNSKGTGFLRVLKSDRVDIREEISKTNQENLYLLSPSPFDAMEEYFDIQEAEIERVMNSLKEIFDIVLVDIPNNPPLEFCYSMLKLCSFGFIMWSERVDAPQNTERFFKFINSIGIGAAKFVNIIMCNYQDLGFDLDVINEMRLRLIAILPGVSRMLQDAFEGKIYVNEAMLIDKEYKKEIERLVDLIFVR